MAFNEQLTLLELNARIENLENQHDKLLYLVHQLVDLRIDTSKLPDLWSRSYGCPSTYMTCQ